MLMKNKRQISFLIKIQELWVKIDLICVKKMKINLMKLTWKKSETSIL